MGAPGGVPSSPFLSGIGKGRFLGSKAAVLQRFDGSAWREVARYGSVHDANAALDHSIGEGEEPGALRIVDATPSAAARALTLAGAAVVAVVVIFLIWFWFVA